MLPYLARYMGHATFDSTYYYIHTSPDFMDAYSGLVTKKATNCCRRLISNGTTPPHR